ncbi:hypothetical protein IFM89_013054 [Coptis chinensis]|uniref:Uncharacterized protein n=1 Tax=Coptis chinensis TaxID=261450 RepID=A0A835LRI3_9MAGN|nr:hypothetical protein IFM89_013054 [Coptis chinensis]
MAESSLTIITSWNIDQCSEDDQENRFKDVEVLRRKMVKLSKGMLERMEEECGSMIFSCASSATSSASNSRRIEFPHLSSSAQVQVVQQPVLLHKAVHPSFITLMTDDGYSQRAQEKIDTTALMMHI